MSVIETETKETGSEAKTKSRKHGASKDSGRKTLLPVLKGLTSGEERKLRLSAATVHLIESKTSTHDAAPSDAIFVATVAAMGRKKTRLPVLQKPSEIDVQLPPALWEFLDKQANESGADHDTLIQSYLGLI